MTSKITTMDTEETMEQAEYIRDLEEENERLTEHLRLKDIMLAAMEIGRKCYSCGAVIADGFIVEKAFTNEYYCSDECRRKKYTDEEYEQMFEDDEAYWTEWYDECGWIKGEDDD